MNKLFLISIISLVLFSSCQKVIKIDLKDEETRLVVESLISDNTEPFKVRLTLLAPYFADNNPPVSTAQVYISDDTGNTDTLFYSGNGFYQTGSNKQAVLGRTYFLKIIFEGKEYNAQSTMPANKMLLDSITYIYNQASAFIEEGYNVILNAQDNPNFNDYYRFIFWKNGVIQTDPFKYFVTDDAQVQGSYIVTQVPYNYQSGDTATVQIQCIDKKYYDYLNAIANQTQASGGPFDPIPANPPTNLNNGALGYFACVTKDTKFIVLP
jgi:hypothetical protein